jgi:peptidoglycan hydrolase-like protein with peptidoglycan-binding domain
MLQVIKEYEHDPLPDGIIVEDFTIEACQRWLHCNGQNPGPIDGFFGNQTSKALENFLHNQGPKYEPCCHVNNKPFTQCRQSVFALQQWLKDNGQNPGPIDGRWGRQSARALQKYLDSGGSISPRKISSHHCPMNGRFGRTLSRACQVWLIDNGENPGPVDGLFGDQTSCAFQSFLLKQGPRYDPGPVDGIFIGGSRSTIAFKLWLKDKGFNPGPIDGCWTKRTVYAFKEYLNSNPCLSRKPNVIFTTEGGVVIKFGF